jgi:SAM-dependent methyltransferase
MMTESHPPICDYEGSDYQKSFWDEGGRSYEDQVEAIALQRLLPKSGKLLLELGAGAGRNTPRYTGFEHIVLLDYSRTQLEQAQKRLGKDERYTYVAGDIYRLPFVDGLFDTATMIRVLHHMAEAPRALGEVRRVMQRDAIFVLEYASKLNLKAILRYLLRRQTWSPFSREPVEFAALNFDFHPAAVRQWLTVCGFQVERTLSVSHYRLGLLKRLLPVSWLVKMDAYAQLTGDWWQLTPSVFTRNRAIGDTPKASPGAFFRCPECGHSPLDETDAAMLCPACGRQWQNQDGIYDFRN